MKSGYDGNEYERWFFYENDQLIFSIYFSGSNEQRFYFYKSRLFRWKDNDATRDKEYDNSGWYEWEDLILSESAKIMDGKYGISMSNLIAIKASSTLEADGYDYNAYNLVDGDRTTAWTEGTDGDGINEYVTFQYEKQINFTGISIRNGYQKSGDLFHKNCRVNVLRIVDGNGEEHYVNVPDEDNLNNIDFYESFTSDFVTVYIDSVYSGDTYEDTCISELTFY